MEHPVKEINSVVRALCQGSPQEQADALHANFLPNASFVHPLCRVPSFAGVNVPGFGEVNSRMFIQAIFKWYKTLSPKIDLEIESSVFDQRAGLLYLTINQTFAIWFVPFYKAPVRLVTVLRLVQCQTTEDGQVISPNEAGGSSGSSTSSSSRANGGDHDASSSSHSHGGRNNGAHNNERAALSGRTRYMIARQEDLYQVNEVLKFVTPGFGAAVWYLWQVISTGLCLLGVVFLTPLVLVLSDRVPGLVPQQHKTV